MRKLEKKKLNTIKEIWLVDNQNKKVNQFLPEEEFHMKNNGKRRMQDIRQSKEDLA
jgi:Uma2 family endonuclease